MAELHNDEQNTSVDASNDEDMREAAHVANKAGKAASGAVKGMAAGGPAGAIVGAVRGGGCSFCGIGCLILVALGLGLLGGLGSLISGWFFGTDSSSSSSNDPGTEYTEDAEDVTNALSEMYAEDMYEINDEIKEFSSQTSTSSDYNEEDGVTYTTINEQEVNQVTLSDGNIIEGSAVETGSGVTYDVDLTDEVCFIIAAYSTIRPYNSSTTDDADDLSNVISESLKEIQLFPIGERTDTQGESTSTSSTTYKTTTDEDGNTVNVYDEDGNQVVDSVTTTVTTEWDMEYPILDFDEEEVYRLFDIDPDAKYINLVSDTTGTDSDGGVITYTFDTFMDLSDYANKKSNYKSKNKTSESNSYEEVSGEDWLDNSIGPFAYVSLNGDGEPDANGKTTYPDDDENNQIDYYFTVYNHTDEDAIAVVKDTVDTNALTVLEIKDIENDGTAGDYSQPDGLEAEYDEDSGEVTWTFPIASHTSEFVQLRCQSTDGAYETAEIDNSARIKLYEVSADSNGNAERDESGSYALGKTLSTMTTNKTMLSTPIQEDKQDKIVSNRTHVEEQAATVMDELRNEKYPTENIDDQTFTVVINNASSSTSATNATTGIFSLQGYIWPLENYGMDKVSSGYGPRNGTTHNGTDVAAPEGTRIQAMKDGVVVANDKTNARGWYVAIKHDDGIVTLYQHMKQQSDLTVGADILQGATVGFVGHTGDTSRNIESGGTDTGDHLHFEVIDTTSSSSYPGNTIDPVTLFQSYSASGGAISVGSSVGTIRERISSYARSFINVSPYVHAGHGDTIGPADPSWSRTDVTLYFNTFSGLYSTSEVSAVKNIIYNNTNIEKLWDDLNYELAYNNYKIGSNTNTAMPYVFDCSGFTGFVYGAFGIDIPLYVSGQMECGENVCDSNGVRISSDTMSASGDSWSSIERYLEVGDLIFTRSGGYGDAGHVVMYIGDGQYVSAAQEGTLIGTGSVEKVYWNNSRVVGIRRIIKE